jgi:hypothetical protein
MDDDHCPFFMLDIIVFEQDKKKVGNHQKLQKNK